MRSSIVYPLVKQAALGDGRCDIIYKETEITFYNIKILLSMESCCVKTCPMQKANGLTLKMCGASYNSLMSGMVLGYSCHPKTLRNFEKA